MVGGDVKWIHELVVRLFGPSRLVCQQTKA